MKKYLQLPLNEPDVRALRAGDTVLLSGTIVTGRDMAHRWLTEEKPDALRPFLLNGAIYHCGPVMVRDKDSWLCRSAGPTTSTRGEAYQADVIREYGLRCVIGKGGMGERTLQALGDGGAVYLHAVGGAAVIYANTVRKVLTVFRLEEFGVPEAMWVMEVADFPAVVTMDSAGNSLHRERTVRAW